MSKKTSGSTQADRQASGELSPVTVIVVVILFVIAALSTLLLRGPATAKMAPATAERGSAAMTAESPTETATSPATATPPPLRLAVAHTNDTWGYLYACG